MPEIFFLLHGINFSVFQIKTSGFKHIWHLEKMKHGRKKKKKTHDYRFS